MRVCSSSLARQIVSAILFMGALTVPLRLLAQESSADSPTASEDPAVIDQVWQQASSKYNAPRVALLKEVDREIGQGPFRADWESLQKFQAPDWYRDAKFGIFIHWGVYSVPAFGDEWYPRNMYVPGTEEYKHHLATFGPQTKFGYKDFIPRFKAEHFDPGKWAQLFKDAGARYVIPVAEHHDGFAMYDSGLSDWTAVKMGPHRDAVGELEKAVRAEGLHFGVSSHRVEHDFYLGVGRAIASDVNDPAYAAFYGPAHNWLENKHGTPLSNDFTYVSSAWTDDWLARSAELVKKYHPDVVYFDWWIGQPSVRAALTRFMAFYYNDSLAHGGRIGVVNYKNWAAQENSAVLDIERGQLGDIRTLCWQTDTSVGNKSWGYVQGETFKTPEFVVHELVDIVSKNGNLLLNIGPRADGTIPDEVQQILLNVGSWLKTNGEAIYGTRPWRIYGEGPTKAAEGAFHDTNTQPYTAMDFRFTTKADVLYAIELGWPSSGEAVIHSISNTAGEQHVKTVDLLGSDAQLSFQEKADGLHIQLPQKAPGEYAYVFRVRFDTGR
jgi:alpha-L-fucosidase